uniref:uncharacterized protein LOC109959645 isoform X2 n=1 Tax=Monopterus albus TaxID=43700 RepID=UPI0009B4D24B|nr:uncharacterized protein LOC109959645 isoform X2 [Monopterus albus]
MALFPSHLSAVRNWHVSNDTKNRCLELATDRDGGRPMKRKWCSHYEPEQSSQSPVIAGTPMLPLFLFLSGSTSSTQPQFLFSSGLTPPPFLSLSGLTPPLPQFFYGSIPPLFLLLSGSTPHLPQFLNGTTPPLPQFLRGPTPPPTLDLQWVYDNTLTPVPVSRHIISESPAAHMSRPRVSIQL